MMKMNGPALADRLIKNTAAVGVLAKKLLSGPLEGRRGGKSKPKASRKASRAARRVTRASR